MIIDPRVIALLKEKASSYSYPSSSWRAYRALLEYLEDAARRAPSLEIVAALDETTIEVVLSDELERLHALLFGAVFIQGGIKDFFEYYEPAHAEYQDFDSNRRAQSGAGSRLVDELQPPELAHVLTEGGCGVFHLSNLGISVVFPLGTINIPLTTKEDLEKGVKKNRIILPNGYEVIYSINPEKVYLQECVQEQQS